jgi:Flp pilus assembly pilin Flp
MPMSSETGRGTASELLIRLLRDESAATIPEYGILVALLTVGVLLGYQSVGQSIGNLFNNFAVTFNAVAP